MKRYVLIGVVVAFAGGVLPALAGLPAYYQVTMTGTVAEVNDPGEDLVIQVNDTWTVVYVFDPHARDDWPIDPHRGEYDAIESISLTIGSCGPVMMIPGSIVVYNDVDEGDTYSIYADVPIDPLDPCIYADYPVDPIHVPMTLNLQDSTGTAWSTDRLPTLIDLIFPMILDLQGSPGTGWSSDRPPMMPEALGAGRFDTRSLSLGGPSVGFDISGGIASLDVVPHAGPGPVPTVSTWGLVILALVLVIGGKVYFTRRWRAMHA